MLFIILGAVAFLQTCVVGNAEMIEPLSAGYINLMECSGFQTDVKQLKNMTLFDVYRAMICEDRDDLLWLRKGYRRPRDCEEVLRTGEKSTTPDGVYKIYPKGAKAFSVYCDMTTSGGGWTVFQRRMDGKESFYRDWQDYAQGFGSFDHEFWLGNDKIHSVVRQGFYKLRVELQDFSNYTRYAEYKTFGVDNKFRQYLLTASGYYGSAGDSLYTHNKQKFSTRDQDNDQAGASCSELYEGGFWFNNCLTANPNGRYLGPKDKHYGHGIIWNSFRGMTVSLRSTKMMFKKQY